MLASRRVVAVVGGRGVSVRTLATTQTSPEVFDFKELVGPSTPEVLAKLQRAYGYDGLGILGVKNIPSFVEKRARLLPLAYKLAHQPQAVLDKYEHAPSFYSVGWSLGKEKLEGKPDFSKGSWYANPLYDAPTDSAEAIAKWPSFYSPNLWPSEVPDLEPAFKELGQLIVHVGTMLTKHCDALVKRELPLYPDQRITKVLQTSRMCKGRLLHYFPSDHGVPLDIGSPSSWCGWHNDHGSLTGLTVAMFNDKDGKEIPCPDKTSGLYIRSRAGVMHRVVLPTDILAFQIGETAQIHSGGVLQATPHSVQASGAPGVSRSTFAVFMEPDATYPMTSPPGADVARIHRGMKNELMPEGVKPLLGRWSDKDDFGVFSDKTLNSYY